MRTVEQNGIAKLVKYEGNARNVVLPNDVDGKPLSVIGAKAFLSCREVERLVLPDGIKRIEDWAFAHMKKLQEIVMPAKQIVFGKKVFLGCHNLKQVNFSGAAGIYEGIPYFLASMVVFMEEHAVEPELAGDLQGQWDWLKEYDRALLQFLEREDSYGFEPAFIGWFDIEDVDDQQAGFVRERQKSKIALGLQRMLYGERLEKETEEKTSAYLLKAWKLALEMLTDIETMYSRDVRYFKIWQRIGGFKVLSRQELLERLPSAEPEIRAFLMECESDEDFISEYFDDLEL